jgi:hypothetical protein
MGTAMSVTFVSVIRLLCDKDSTDTSVKKNDDWRQAEANEFDDLIDVDSSLNSNDWGWFVH